MKSCITCQKPGSLAICRNCAERAESMLFPLVPWTKFEKATVHPDILKEGFTECWMNSRYTVLWRDVESPYGELVHLSIKRNDKNPMHDWRDLQRIKNEILGPEQEAMELYPAESRLIDTANQYHIWAFLKQRAPFGYETERCVMEDVETAAGGGGKQRKFEEKPKDLITEEKWNEKLEACRREKQLAGAGLDLLAALKDCMAQIESYDPGGCKVGQPYDRLKAARAAIERAEKKL